MGRIAELEREAEEFDKQMEEARKASETAQTPAGDQTAGETVTPQSTDTATTEAAPAQEIAPAATPASEINYQAEYERLKAILDDENRDTWRNKYVTLEGKYRVEVPRLSAQLAELKGAADRIAGLEAQVKDLTGKLEAKTEAAKTPQESAAMKKLREEFGDDFAQSLGEITSTLQGEITDLKAQLAEAKKAKPEAAPAPVAAPAANDPQVAFWRDVLLKVPDFDQINGNADQQIPTDPRFVSFLSTIDPASKLTWRDVAENHLAKMNVAGVEHVFNSFRKYAGTAPAATGTKTPTVSKELEEHIDPNKGKTGGSKPPQEKRTYTLAEIDREYKEHAQALAKGKPKYTAEEWEAKDREYSDAIAEGRVR